MYVQLVKEFYAEAAHANALGLHGHSFRIEVVVAGETDPNYGWLIDYGDIKAQFQPLYDQLDHHYLNEVPGLDDVSIAGLRQWIRDRLEPGLPGLEDIRVAIVGDGAFRPEHRPADPERDLPARVRFTFEAAQSLPHLPEGHPCRRLHGHTYRIEVATHEPVATSGRAAENETIAAVRRPDLPVAEPPSSSPRRDVPVALSPPPRPTCDEASAATTNAAADLDHLHKPLRALYDALDHRFLNEIPGLESATSERLCRWMWERLEPEVDGLDTVIVQETATARCVYHGR